MGRKARKGGYGAAKPPQNWVNCSEFSVNLHAAACKLTSMTVLTVLARQLGNCTDCLQVTAPASLAAAICIRIFVLMICLVDGFTIQRHVQSTPQHNTASSRA
jgi:hypothetical protein